MPPPPVVLPPLVQRHTVNQSSRHGTAITHLVWHATAGAYAPSVEWLCNPDADASAHLVLREDGNEATQLVKFSEKAWHAVGWNSFSVGVEHASHGQGFASRDQIDRSQRIFAWLCLHLNIPPVFGLNKPRGLVRHRDLGVAGGGHSDGPTDQVWFHEYLPGVQAEIARGDFRKSWAL
jgi:N-acetyl-anhydromuramyl-L-alanine amidase AmpD